MKRNQLLALLLVPILAMVLAACGGNVAAGNATTDEGINTNTASAPSDSAATSSKPSTSSSTVDNAPRASLTVKPQFIMFSTTWCPICKAMRPIVSELKGQYSDRVVFREVDREDPANAALVAKYGINAQPIFVLLDKHGKTAGQIFGGTDKQTLKAALDNLLQ